MIKPTKIFAAALSAILLSTGLASAEANAAAESKLEGVYVNAGVSSLGRSLDVGYRYNDTFGFRGQINRFDYSDTVDVSGDQVAVDLALKSQGVFVDIHPTGKNLRFSVGALMNDNSAALSGSYTGSFTFNGQTFTAPSETTISGRVTFPKIAPVATVGYYGNLGKHVSIGLDVGAVFQGAGTLDVTTAGFLANDPTFTAEVDSKVAEIQNDLDQFSVYPIVRAGISIRF